jgi:hypothetical protein
MLKTMVETAKRKSLLPSHWVPELVYRESSSERKQMGENENMKYKWAKISKSGKRRKSFFCNNFFKIVQKLIL